MKSIGCFVSPHGFGHATRVSAILESLCQLTKVEAHIYTTVDESIFAQGSYNYTYHHITTDVGFVQHDAFHLDIPETITQLQQLFPFDPVLLRSLAHECRQHRLLLCDISALGITIGKITGVPSVLVENFTWDWLYEPFLTHHPGLNDFSNYLGTLYAEADVHIQTEPFCQSSPSALRCGPIFRKIREPAERLLPQFDCGKRKVVFITLGGISFTPQFIDKLLKLKDSYFFIIGGQSGTNRVGDNILLLDSLTPHYHPDLINVADITVFKGGYSTLAECYQVGKPTLFITRENFAESHTLENFAKKEMGSIIVDEMEFTSGRWLSHLSALHHLKPPQTPVENGADQVAATLFELL